MRSLLRHVAAARQALRSAELASRQQQAACVHGLSPAPFASSTHCLHISAAASASKDDGEQAEEKSEGKRPVHISANKLLQSCRDAL